MGCPFGDLVTGQIAAKLHGERGGRLESCSQCQLFIPHLPWSALDARTQSYPAKDGRKTRHGNCTVCHGEAPTDCLQECASMDFHSVERVGILSSRWSMARQKWNSAAQDRSQETWSHMRRLCNASWPKHRWQMKADCHAHSASSAYGTKGYRQRTAGDGTFVEYQSVPVQSSNRAMPKTPAKASDT